MCWAGVCVANECHVLMIVDVFVFVVVFVLFFLQRHYAPAWTLEPRPTCFFHVVFFVGVGFVDDV